jgi:hypothetical protein
MADLPAKPSPQVPPSKDDAAEERFWRAGRGGADAGAVPPEPGTTPAELAEETEETEEAEPESGLP